jgi:hypothetical protein
MFGYMARLEASDVLRSVQLLTYERKNGRFLFNLAADWHAS